MKNYKYVFNAFTFFDNPIKHDFLRFLSSCTRFLEHWAKVHVVLLGAVNALVRLSMSCFFSKI